MKTVKKRRKQCRTDYKKRLGLLKSGKPRVVFRRTNKYVIAQYVESFEAQDKIVFGVSSKELLKFGIGEKASLKNISACYLTGYLMGKRLLKKKLETPIVDVGMLRMISKNKVYAFLKGLIDSGVGINCKEEVLPDEARIKGEHLRNKIDVEGIKNAMEKK